MAASNKPHFVGRHNLGLDDLGIVLNELFSCRDKWYNLGLQLKVKVEVLQKIETEYKNDYGTCLRQMLTKWLESGRGSWETLCQAIDSPIVRGDDNSLVARLRGKFCQGEEGKKGKKRPTDRKESTESDTPTAKKPKVALPDTLDPDDFVKPPPSDRRCVKCGRVPTNPQCSACCHLVYCEPCSNKMTLTFCPTHQIPLSFVDDKKLRTKIFDLRSNCPNWRKGCNFKDGVSKVYRQHLPECQYQGGGSLLSDKTVKKKATATSAGKSKELPIRDKSDVVKKPKPKAIPTLLPCKYHRIGCRDVFASHAKVEQHLLEKIQHHLDLAIGKMEEMMDI